MSGSMDETGQACGIEQAIIIATTHVKQSMYLLIDGLKL